MKMQKKLISTQQGVVLPLALVLLVVISIIGIWAIGSSTSSEKMMQSQRSNATAQQAAELALRVCEEVAIENAEGSGSRWQAFHTKVIESPAVTNENDTSALWRQKSNWRSGATHRIDIPAGEWTSLNAGELKNSPQCIVQKMGSNSYLITARGLGNDVKFTSQNQEKTKTGAEVWLQSVITPES